jgi:hypothetical protein
MGRSFASVRQELKSVAERWARAARGGYGCRTRAGTRLAGWAKEHASEAFFGCDGPAEAALFSALVELRREQEPHAGGGGGDDPVDP